MRNSRVLRARGIGMSLIGLENEMVLGETVQRLEEKEAGEVVRRL